MDKWSKKYFTNTWDLHKFPDGVMQALQRPSGDGYSKDVEFSLKVQQMKNQNAQAQAAANAWSDLNKAIKGATPKSTYTNCYNTFGGVNCNSTTYRSSYMCISVEEWRFINSFAPWLSVIGTLLAVCASLYISYSTRKIALSISSGVVVFNENGVDEEF